ncbi:uncharacterized protein LOC123705313 isoform X1 [Colias croceus]|uniref:uncharacterized protein LOC123705313 isoform X1 n=1 Tax=Colias crocea TaxID=72248 RepID=UPI001E27E194|nr:uncharacterized protein LOC123705313 isoform X1 [Colias croceus]
MGKSGTGGLPGKSSGKSIGKSTHVSSSPKPSAKLPTITPSTSTKSSLTPQYTGKNKSSTSIGVIWLPIRKKNKYKEYAYNAYQNKQREKERAPTMYNFMSGDSSHNPVPKKIEEETSLLVPDKTAAALGGVGTVSLLQDPPDISTDKDSDEKPGELTRKENPKDAAGDSINEKNNDYLENDEKVIIKPPNTDLDKKDKLSDNVDSVYIKPKPAHKTRSSTPTPEEESCGIKCLYYTLQCCDCVLM